MKRILSVMFLCFFCANAIFAEEEKKPSILGETLDRLSEPFGALFTPYKRLDPIVVTPTRYEDPALDVSSNISVIDEKKIGESYARYTPDILRDESGVVVSDLLGNGKAMRIDMRGFGDSSVSNVLVLVDGRRTNQIDLSGPDWIQINLGSVERVEVTRGPKTVLYGDNATAGVVNIITKKGAGLKPEISFGYDVGSYRYSAYRGAIQEGSPFLDYFGMISTSYNNGYRINNNLETIDYNANITLKPSDLLHMRFSGGYHKDWYGLPGALKPVDLNDIGPRGSISPDNRGKTEDYYLTFTPEVKYDLGLGEMLFYGDILMRGRRNNSIFYSVWGDVSNVNHIVTFGVTPKLAFTTELFDIKNRMLVGLDYYGNKNEINSGELSAMDRIIINKDSLGLYATDTVELPFNLILSGGFRSEWGYYKFNQEAILEGKIEK